MAKAIGVDWKLHRAYRPQGSGQVENSKETLTKLNFEADGDWVVLFPFAFYRVRHTPYS